VDIIQIAGDVIGYKAQVLQNRSCTNETFEEERKRKESKENNIIVMSSPYNCNGASVPVEVSVPSGMTCCRCRQPSPDLLFVGCGCNVHAMCVPTSTICKREGQAKAADALTCPNCGKSASKGIYLYPIDVQALEQTILSRAAPASSSFHNHNNGNNSNNNSNNNNNNCKYNKDQSDALEEFYASIAPLFLLTWASQNSAHERRSSMSSSNSASSSSTAASSFDYQPPPSTFTDDDVSFRNGRWSTEEVQFVDAAMKSFDEGDLPISKGTTLNDFLRSLLLCKSTRLRKKIKNANFCTRTYCPRVNTLHSHATVYGTTNTANITTANNDQTTSPVPPMNDLTMKLADQQQHFVSSVDDDSLPIHKIINNNNNNNTPSAAGVTISSSYSYDRNLLKFSLSRTWGMLFSKFCSEVGYTNLLSDDWWKGLEEIEEKAVAAKNRRTRALRRKRVDSVASAVVNQSGDGGGGLSQIQSSSSYTTMIHNSGGVQQQHLPVIPDVSINTSALHIDCTPNAVITPKRHVIHDETNNINIPGHRNHQPHQQQQQQVQSSLVTSNNDVPLHLQSKRARLLNDVLSEAPSNIPDIADLCNQMSDWNPFIEKITNFLVDEHLPFQYFDIWISDQKHKADNDNYDKRTVSLRHVGHATNPKTDCIFTIYHMNEFGRYSSNFKFTPGIGLPGRVYTTGMPLWDDSLETANLDDFPRVDGARSHGLKKALGIPLPGRTAGETIVIALYSAGAITKDETLMQKCCSEFQRYRPKVKWELVLDIGSYVDVGNNDGSESNMLTLTNQESKEMDVVSVSDRRDSLDDTDYLATTDAEEDAMINVLGRYAPMENSTNLFAGNLQESFTSLRLLLLRTPPRRTDDEIGVIETLKRSYRHYLQAGRKENEVAMLLANDWMVLRSECGRLPKPVHPIAINMTEINYANLTRDRTLSAPILWT